MYSQERVDRMNMRQLCTAIMILKVQIVDLTEAPLQTAHYCATRQNVVDELTKTHTQLIEELRKRRNQPHEATYSPAPKHANYAH